MWLCVKVIGIDEVVPFAHNKALGCEILPFTELPRKWVNPENESSFPNDWTLQDLKQPYRVELTLPVSLIRVSPICRFGR
jgi:hypothetical protein